MPLAATAPVRPRLAGHAPAAPGNAAGTGQAAAAAPDRPVRGGPGGCPARRERPAKPALGRSRRPATGRGRWPVPALAGQACRRDHRRAPGPARVPQHHPQRDPGPGPEEHRGQRNAQSQPCHRVSLSGAWRPCARRRPPGARAVPGCQVQTPKIQRYDLSPAQSETIGLIGTITVGIDHELARLDPHWLPRPSRAFRRDTSAMTAAADRLYERDPSADATWCGCAPGRAWPSHGPRAGSGAASPSSRPSQQAGLRLRRLLHRRSGRTVHRAPARRVPDPSAQPRQPGTMTCLPSEVPEVPAGVARISAGFFGAWTRFSPSSPAVSGLTRQVRLGLGATTGGTYATPASEHVESAGNDGSATPGIRPHATSAAKGPPLVHFGSGGDRRDRGPADIGAGPYGRALDLTRSRAAR